MATATQSMQSVSAIISLEKELKIKKMAFEKKMKELIDLTDANIIDYKKWEGRKAQFKNLIKSYLLPTINECTKIAVHAGPRTPFETLKKEAEDLTKIVKNVVIAGIGSVIIGSFFSDRRAISQATSHAITGGACLGAYLLSLWQIKRENDLVDHASKLLYMVDFHNDENKNIAEKIEIIAEALCDRFQYAIYFLPCDKKSLQPFASKLVTAIVRDFVKEYEQMVLLRQRKREELNLAEEIVRAATDTVLLKKDRPILSTNEILNCIMKSCTPVEGDDIYRDHVSFFGAQISIFTNATIQSDLGEWTIEGMLLRSPLQYGSSYYVRDNLQGKDDNNRTDKYLCQVIKQEEFYRKEIGHKELVALDKEGEKIQKEIGKFNQKLPTHGKSKIRALEATIEELQKEIEELEAKWVHLKAKAIISQPKATPITGDTNDLVVKKLSELEKINLNDLVSQKKCLEEWYNLELTRKPENKNNKIDIQNRLETIYSKEKDWLNCHKAILELLRNIEPNNPLYDEKLSTLLVVQRKIIHKPESKSDIELSLPFLKELLERRHARYKMLRNTAIFSALTCLEEIIALSLHLAMVEIVVVKNKDSNEKAVEYYERAKNLFDKNRQVFINFGKKNSLIAIFQLFSKCCKVRDDVENQRQFLMQMEKQLRYSEKPEPSLGYAQYHLAMLDLSTQVEKDKKSSKENKETKDVIEEVIKKLKNASSQYEENDIRMYKCYKNLFHAYNRLKDPEKDKKELEYLEQAREIARTASTVDLKNNPIKAIKAPFNLAEYHYRKKGGHSEILKYVNESLEIQHSIHKERNIYVSNEIKKLEAQTLDLLTNILIEINSHSITDISGEVNKSKTLFLSMRQYYDDSLKNKVSELSDLFTRYENRVNPQNTGSCVIL